MATEHFFATRWGIVIISPERAGKIPDEAFQRVCMSNNHRCLDIFFGRERDALPFILVICIAKYESPFQR
jgi:hypothetical protein